MKIKEIHLFSKKASHGNKNGLVKIVSDSGSKNYPIDFNSISYYHNFKFEYNAHEESTSLYLHDVLPEYTREESKFLWYEIFQGLRPMKEYVKFPVEIRDLVVDINFPSTLKSLTSAPGCFYWALEINSPELENIKIYLDKKIINKT